jgi:hypothetical protein
MATSFDIASQNNLGVLSTNPYEQSISEDGNYVVFESPYGAAGQAYVKNEANSMLTLVSSSSAGVASNAGIFDPTISESADGSQVEVGFNSTATNLDPAATAGINEVYVKNVNTGGLTLVSAAGGVAANSGSEDEALSTNAAFVSFDSAATNLGLGATGAANEVYVRNMAANTLMLASQTSAGTQANAAALNQSISSDGSEVVFDSAATDLGSTSGATEVYVKNATSAAGALSIVSETAGGVIADGGSSGGSISADGSKVAFSSTANNLVTGVTAGISEIYLKNLQTGVVSLVSSASNGTIANASSFEPILSADGNFVMFESAATNLVASATSGLQQVYVKNLQTGAIALLSSTAAGAAGSNDSFVSTFAGEQAFSEDDAKAVFATYASNLSGTSSLTVLRATTSGPALTTNPVDGNNVVSAAQLAAATFTGTTDAPTGSTVTVAIDAAADTVGTAVVQADGSWSVTADLGALAQGAHTEIATVQGAQYLTTTADEGFTVNTAGPAVTFNTGVAFSHPTKATLTGTVSDPTGVTSLEVFSGSKDLGAATIHKNGNWTFAATLSRGFHDAISVEATDGIGNTSSTPAPFELQTGIRGQPYTTQETDLNSLGQDVGETYTQADGGVYLQDVIVNKPNGALIVDYASGSYFDSLGYFFQTFDISPNGAVDQQIFYNNDGTHSEVGSANNQRLVALGDDTMTGGGNRETFVFKANPGDETITDFNATGPGHDTIALQHSHFTSFAQVLNDAMQQSGANTVIALGPHSSITLDNVAVSSLTRNDFTFHS